MSRGGIDFSRVGLRSNGTLLGLQTPRRFIACRRIKKKEKSMQVINLMIEILHCKWPEYAACMLQWMQAKQALAIWRLPWTKGEFHRWLNLSDNIVTIYPSYPGNLPIILFLYASIMSRCLVSWSLDNVTVECSEYSQTTGKIGVILYSRVLLEPEIGTLYAFNTWGSCMLFWTTCRRLCIHFRI